MNDDDLMDFASEPDEAPAPPSPPLEPWRLLVVDDEPQMHSVTLLALAGLEVDGRRLVIEHAYDGGQAREHLRARDDWAVMLLDVVMETEHAGLDVVRWMRNDLQNLHTRVILRTGEPGAAPQREVMLGYDVNDYQPKADLSAQRLITCVVGGIRAWRDLRLAHAGRSRSAEPQASLDDRVRGLSRFAPLSALNLLGCTAESARAGDNVTVELTALVVVRGDSLSLDGLVSAAGPLVAAHGGFVHGIDSDSLVAWFTGSKEAMAAGRRIVALGLDAWLGLHVGPTRITLVGDSGWLACCLSLPEVFPLAARVHRRVGRLLVTPVLHRSLPAALVADATRDDDGYLVLGTE